MFFNVFDNNKKNNDNDMEKLLYNIPLRKTFCSYKKKWHIHRYRRRKVYYEFDDLSYLLIKWSVTF